MSTDNQYTALGPAAIGFQTDGANIDVGADVAGKKFGARGRCENGSGVIGESDTMGVFGSGNLRGVYGSGHNPFQEPQNTTGVLGEGYEEASGVIGLSFLSKERSALGGAAGVIGGSNADSEKRVGAGVVGLSLKAMPQLIDTT